MKHICFVSLLLISFLTTNLLAKNKPMKVLVRNFSSTTLDSNEIKPVTNFFANLLRQFPEYDVISFEEATALADQYGSTITLDCEDDLCLEAIAGAIDAPFIVSGEIDMVGTRYIVNVSMLDVYQASTVKAVSEMAPSLDGAMDLLVTIAPRIAGRNVSATVNVPTEKYVVDFSGTPLNASILIDGAPMTNRELPRGAYRFTIFNAGYISLDTTVKITDDREIDYSLIAENVAISVQAIDSETGDSLNATVLVLDSKVGTTSWSDSLPSETSQIIVSHDGFKSDTIAIDLLGREQLSVISELTYVTGRFLITKAVQGDTLALSLLGCVNIEKASGSGEPSPWEYFSSEELNEEYYSVYLELFDDQFFVGSYSDAFDLLRKGANAGSVSAMYQLGTGYKSGEGITQNYSEAIRWFRLAAADGSTKAMNSIGYMYSAGEGVTQNYEEAQRWYRLSADFDNAIAMYVLGVMYENGSGVVQDYSEAIRWFRLAADEGNSSAMMGLGKLHRDGKGVTQNYTESLRWYHLSADMGNTKAMISIGNMHQNGDGVPLNYEEALRWYRLAADEGDANAMIILGGLYRDGKGVTQDYAEASRWHRLAANSGDADIMDSLSSMYNSGNGITLDMITADKWLQKSTQIGSTSSQ